MNEKLKSALIDIALMSILFTISLYIAYNYAMFIAGIFLLTGMFLISHLSEKRDFEIRNK